MAIWWQYFCKVIRVFLPAMERGRHPKQPNQHARAPRLSTSLSSNRISGVVSQRSCTPHLGAGFLLVQWWCPSISDIYPPTTLLFVGCGSPIFPIRGGAGPNSRGCALALEPGGRDACPTWSWRHEPPTDSVNACRNLDAKVTKNDQKWRKK